ncbi:MAG: dihydrolipoyl dehydrogenase [Acidobacteriota bacterium]|nr:dihydrolipoyl dehydrogenase [Acidobacteriota bacterium]MDH3522063.1 dihydrolipoyl dehydrogenase [Acidobacteriota bacterium]
MSALREIRVPDLGDVAGVTVVELLVAVGDRVAADDGLVTLESDKASMDVPATAAGVVRELLVGIGDTVAAGDPIARLDEEAATAGLEPPPATPKAAEEPAAETRQAAADPGAEMATEVVVLGSGPGGYTAAFRAADLGKKVTLVERYATLGGVCLNVGCIPSKALLHAARVLDEAAEFRERGIDFGEPKIDLERLRGWKDSVVAQLTGGIAGMAKRRGVEIVQGVGELIDPHTLAVEAADGRRTVRFEQAILAVGSRVARIPGIPYDDPRVLDSTTALELADVPARLLIVGGGVIGLEMATVYGALGSAVTVVELEDGLIPGCDRDLVRPLEKRLRGSYGAEILVSTGVAAAVAREDGLEVRFEGERAPAPAIFDRLLVAVGRRPNGDRIGAAAAGIEVDGRGFVPVDRERRTNVRHIFAVGDLTGLPMLAHKATHEARVAAEVAAGEKSGFDARVIPAVAYTDPEVAWVGLTETDARASGVAYETGKFPWSASGRSLAMGRREGATKLLFDPATKRLLGAGIVGPNAGELVAELALAIEMDCEAADLALTVHPHPTLAETVGLAAEAFEGTITDLYLPRRRPPG